MSILFLSAKPLCLDDLAVKTRNSLLIPWSGSKITEFGQNSRISNWKSKTPCFLPCYLPRIENCRFTGSACIRKIRVYPRELVGFDLLSCFQSHALDGTAGLHHWRYLRLAAGEGKGVELAGRNRKQHLLYRGFLAFWTLCRFPAAMDLYRDLNLWLVELAAWWRSSFEIEDKSYLANRHAAI